MKHTTQELAEIIAMKCAVEICYKCGLNPEYQDNIETFMPAILSSTALVELLECAKELKDLASDLAINTTCLTNLNIKLKSLIGEEI